MKRRKAGHKNFTLSLAKKTFNPQPFTFNTLLHDIFSTCLFRDFAKILYFESL